MRINPISFSNCTSYKNKRFELKDNNSSCTNLSDMPYYQIFFGAKSNAEKLAYIGEDNFPNQEILFEYKKSVENKDDSVFLCQIHEKFYSGLLDCSVLDEAKELYPEFKDVLNASEVSEENKSSILSKIKSGEINGVDEKSLSLELLKRHYAKMLGHTKKESYWGISAKSITSLFEKLNIKPLNREYFLTITRETPERRAICSQNTLKLWQDGEYRQGRSDDAKKRWQRPEYQQMRRQSLQKQWDDPEKRAKQAEAMRQMHERSDFEEKRLASIQRNWNDPQKREELTGINRQNVALRWDDPEARAKMSEMMKAKWQDPEYREKICSGISQRMIERWKDPEYIEFKTAAKTEQWKNPEFRRYMSDVMKEHWKNPEFREKMAIYNEALRLAWDMHPDISKRMSEIAKEFPGLGRILSKSEKGIELSEQEERLMSAYYKKCHQEMPDFTKIVGQTQREILAFWGIIEL